MHPLQKSCTLSVLKGTLGMEVVIKFILYCVHLKLTAWHDCATLKVKVASPNSYRQLGFRSQHRHVPILISFACNSRISVWKSIWSEVNRINFNSHRNRSIRTSSVGQNISTRGIYTISLIFVVYSLLLFNLCARLRKIIIITSCEHTTFNIQNWMTSETVFHYCKQLTLINSLFANLVH